MDAPIILFVKKCNGDQNMGLSDFQHSLITFSGIANLWWTAGLCQKKNKHWKLNVIKEKYVICVKNHKKWYNINMRKPGEIAELVSNR